MASRLSRVAALTAALGAGFGCNAILGIDEPKLVEDTGSGGRGSGGRGSGGDDESGGTDGGGNETGSGGTASGGKGGGSGGKATGGGTSTGGRGSGGAQSGGSPGTGGEPEGGTNAPSGVPGQVACGTESCRIASGSACCVETASGEPHCATSCDSATQSRFACDGAEDCSGGTPICCLPTGGAVAQCAASCTGRVFCGADTDCAPGQYCAPGGGALAVVSVCTPAPTRGFVWCDGEPCDTSEGKGCCFNKQTRTTSCTATCGGNDVKYTCDDSSDCASGTVCCETRTGLQVLTGSSCRDSCPTAQLQCSGPGVCGAGEACCRTATGAAACSAQECVLSSQLCGNDADCPGTAQCTLVTGTAASEPSGRTTCTPPAP